jgi:hypothetical protein
MLLVYVNFIYLGHPRPRSLGGAEAHQCSLSLHGGAKKTIVRMIVINDYPDYHIPRLDTRYALRGDLEGTDDVAASRIAAFLSRNVLAYLGFLSRTSRTLPSESCSSPSSVSCSDPVSVMVVAGGGAEVTTAERKVTRACLLTGSYHALPRVDSVGKTTLHYPPFQIFTQ